MTELEAETEVLRPENTALRTENAALRKALDDQRRAGKRQAAPFSRGLPKANPKKAGRKPGGSRSGRSVPERIERTVVVPPRGRDVINSCIRRLTANTSARARALVW